MPLDILWLCVFRIVDQLVGFMKWNHWKSKNLSYFLDKRAIRMVSGASMIFSAPKVQWVQVLDRLIVSAESSDDSLCDTIVSLLILCSGMGKKKINYNNKFGSSYPKFNHPLLFFP